MPSAELSPTPSAAESGGLNLLLIGGIIAAVAVFAAVILFILIKKRGMNEKSLQKASFREFQDWVIKKFNGKPSDPASGISGFTEGGQPLLISQSNHLSLVEVEDFVKTLAKGAAQRGTIVAFNFDNDTVEGKVTAMDQGIELQLLRVYELVNKRYAKRISSIASAQTSFEASDYQISDDPAPATSVPMYETIPLSNPRSTDTLGKPRVFISNSNTKVADQIRRMIEFLHYDYVVGDKEDASVPLSENKFGLMRNSDCAIITIAAAEQERRYSGLYVLNPMVSSEINAAYLKYNTQVILVVERKVELPPNLKGLKRIEYDSDDLSFNAAMELEKALVDFRKI